MTRALVGLSLLIVWPCVSLAQRFEMADVHASAPGTVESGGFMPEGRLEFHGATMLTLIATAYDVTTDLVSGGPAWLDADRFDISAKASSRRASPESIRGMLRTLLAERFGLAVHKEKKGMPVYLLAVGRHGAKLRPAASPDTTECPAVDGSPGINHRECSSYSMADLSRLLPQIAKMYVDRPVVDITGLTGAYDFELDWMEKAAYLAAGNNPSGGTMFDALDKLGLELQPGTRPVPVILVDHINRAPSVNVDTSAPAVPTQFEVAEVRLSRSATAEGLQAMQNGRLEIMGYSLRKLLAMAFEVRTDKITGGPTWLDTERFDVIAKSPEVMSPHAMLGMLKTLLMQRFDLQTHTEDKPSPVYALVQEKSSPKLKETDGTSRSACKLKPAKIGRSYVCHNTTMTQLAIWLPGVTRAYLNYPMVDLTGLKGAYDFTLTWTPNARLSASATPPAKGVLSASTPSGGLTIFEAIDKQLGLKLQEQKHPMPVIVIDRVERSENL